MEHGDCDGDLVRRPIPKAVEVFLHERRDAKIKLFTDNDVAKLEGQVNDWLRVNGNSIQVTHSQTTTGLGFSEEQDPVSYVVISIWYSEDRD
jgi:hypothetical protein